MAKGTIGGKTGVGGYRQFKQLEPPPKPPKPRRGLKTPLLLAPEWPPCQHSITPPGKCEVCHPRVQLQHYG